MRLRAILRETGKACRRFSGLLTVPTVLFAAAIGPFIWGLHLVYEPLAWVIPSGMVIVLAVRLALPPKPAKRGPQ